MSYSTPELWGMHHIIRPSTVLVAAFYLSAVTLCIYPDVLHPTGRHIWLFKSGNAPHFTTAPLQQSNKQHLIVEGQAQHGALIHRACPCNNGLPSRPYSMLAATALPMSLRSSEYHRSRFQTQTRPAVLRTCMSGR